MDVPVLFALIFHPPSHAPAARPPKVSLTSFAKGPRRNTRDLSQGEHCDFLPVPASLSPDLGGVKKRLESSSVKGGGMKLGDEKRQECKVFIHDTKYGRARWSAWQSSELR